MTHYRTDDVRIEQGDELLAPMQVMRELASTERSEQATFEGRKAVHDILRGADDRLLVVVGPCSIHDYAAAVDYAKRLKGERERQKHDLAIVMRVYFEKPRTTESQSHRQLASGLSCPVGFKNGTDGNIRIAVDAIKAASARHHFISVTKSGHVAVFKTAGNEDCHVILRGGKQPNYDAQSVDAACKELAAAGLAQRLMVDFSHANSSKQYQKQIEVGRDVAGQLAKGERRIVGVMIESHIHPGRQDLVPGKPLEYGVSITDACLGWDDTVKLLDALAEGVRQRRVAVEE